jgi:hypothetical protein
MGLHPNAFAASGVRSHSSDGIKKTAIESVRLQQEVRFFGWIRLPLDLGIIPKENSHPPVELRP